MTTISTAKGVGDIGENIVFQWLCEAAPWKFKVFEFNRTIGTAHQCRDGLTLYRPPDFAIQRKGGLVSFVEVKTVGFLSKREKPSRRIPLSEKQIDSYWEWEAYFGVPVLLCVLDAASETVYWARSSVGIVSTMKDAKRLSSNPDLALLWKRNFKASIHDAFELETPGFKATSKGIDEWVDLEGLLYDKNAVSFLAEGEEWERAHPCPHCRGAGFSMNERPVRDGKARSPHRAR